MLSLQFFHQQTNWLKFLNIKLIDNRYQLY